MTCGNAVPTGGRMTGSNLGGVTTLDSAGLALLVKWAKAALARGATPQLVGASSDFYTLANLYGVAGLFSQPRSQLRTHNASL